MIYGTERTKAEDVPKLLDVRKITFPLLLDSKLAYRKATRLAVYPTATLLDHKGRVLWQGQPFFRKKFADECEKQIESVIARIQEEAAGPAKR